MLNALAQVNRARVEAAKHPSVLAILEDPAAPPAIVQSVSIFVAKEKERDAFVAAASRLHQFAENISQLEHGGPVNVRLLVAEAKAVLQVCFDTILLDLTLTSKFDLQETGAYIMAQKLPDGWEARTTREGMTYYIDHINKRSTWIHPSLGHEPVRGGEVEQVTMMQEQTLKPPKSPRTLMQRLGGRAPKNNNK